jgi:hypothetical protein
MFHDLAGRFAAILENTKVETKFISLNFATNGAQLLYDIVFVPWVVFELQREEIPSLISHAVAACESGGFVVVLERPQDDYRKLILDAFANEEVTREFSGNESVKGRCGVDFPGKNREIFFPKMNYHSNYYVFRKQ